MPKTLIICEWVPDTLPDDVATFIASTPGAARLFRSKQINYTHFENLDLDRVLFENEHAYFNLQMDALHKWDRTLQTLLPLADQHALPLFTSNYLRVKYVLDTAYLETRAAQSLLEKFRPEKVYLYLLSQSDPVSLFDLTRSGRSFFHQALEKLCRLKGIAVTTVNDKKISKVLRPKTESQLSSLKQIVKIFFNFFKFHKNALPQKNHLSESIAVLHAGSPDVDEIVRRNLKEGKRVYLAERAGFYEESLLRKFSPFPAIDSNEAKKISDACTAAACQFDLKSDFYEFYNSQCALIASEITASWFELFIRKDCPQILVRILNYAKILAQLGITKIFARGNTDIDSIACLLAARHVLKIETICIQHASCGLLSEAMSVYDTNTYDLTLARDGITAASLSEAKQRRNEPFHNISISPHYLEWVKRSHQSKNCHSNRVLYVEKKFSGYARCINENQYALTDYYEFQQRVIALFAQKSQFKFIYKHAVGQKWAEESILKDIADGRAGNISIKSEPFLDALKTVGRVIMDYPSGSLFEALAVGVPVLCLYPDYFQITQAARQAFGRILQPFSSHDNALQKIEEFLSAPAVDYLIRPDWTRTYGTIARSDFMKAVV